VYPLFLWNNSHLSWKVVFFSSAEKFIVCYFSYLKFQIQTFCRISNVLSKDDNSSNFYRIVLREERLLHDFSALCPVLFFFGVLLGSLSLALVAGSGGGCVHWTPPFLVDLVYHISLHKIIIIMPISNKIEKKESLTEVQHGKHETVAGSVWLNLFMDGSGNCKLPSTPLSTGWSRIQHLNVK
jgi:hypothetical protein